MRLVRTLALVNGAATRVVAAHCGHDRNRRRERRKPRGGEHHARKARLYRNARELASGLSERDLAGFRVAAYGAELQKFAESLVDHRRLGRVYEGEALYRAEAQVEHGEYDPGER